MKKLATLQGIVRSKVVAVIRADASDQALRLAEAAQRGGIKAVEITFTVPFAHEILREAARRVDGTDMILGAGSVLDPETARIAILEGAQYIVTPALNEETVRLCNRYQIPCIPGVMTVAETQRALECGADLIKLFPGELLGPGAVRAIRGPLPQANLVPTGGVSLENVKEWFDAGAVAVAVGGSLTGPGRTGDMEAVTRTAKLFLEKVG